MAAHSKLFLSPLAPSLSPSEGNKSEPIKCTPIRRASGSGRPLQERTYLGIPTVDPTEPNRAAEVSSPTLLGTGGHIWAFTKLQNPLIGPPSSRIPC